MSAPAGRTDEPATPTSSDRATLPPAGPDRTADSLAGSMATEEGPTLSQAGGAGAGAPVAPDAIPGYEILGELGRGGMGVVYKARQLGLNRVVALKMVLAGPHAGAAAVERFRTEAQAIAKLRHPNIVQVFDISDLDGMPFFSLEFCEGGSLSADLGHEPQPPKDAAFMVETLARAMDYAHQNHVLHRDLKPANVLLTADGELKITDFGLAKRLDDDAGRTRTGQAMGTPSYMAPEQVEGKKDVGPAADTYALGAMLYEMITGRPPFKAATSMDTMMQVVSDEPIPPRKLVPRTPIDLETICLKCLSKQPKDRYATAGALAADLAAFQAGDPIKARRVSDLERFRRWTRRHPTLSLMIALSVVIPAVGFAAMSASWNRMNETLANAMKPSRDARGDVAPPADAGPVWQHGRVGRFLDTRLWSVAADPNGKRIAAGGEDGTIRVIDAVTRQEVKKLAAHADAVLGLAFRGDGLLASAGSDGAVKVWNVDTGTCEKTVAESGPPVRAVAFGPAGKHLAAAQGKVVRLWDTKSWELLRTLDGHDRAVNSVAFSPGGATVVSTGDDRRMRLWDVATGAEQPGPQVGGDRRTGAVFDATGRKVYLVGWGGGLGIWTPPAAGVAGVPGGSQRPVSLALAPNGKWVAYGGWDRVVSVVPATGQPEAVTVLTGVSDVVTAVTFSPDGRTLYAASWDRSVHVWTFTEPARKPE